MNKLWHYNGSVIDDFGRLLDRHYKASTWAPTVNKARSNILYQYKQRYNLSERAKIHLVGRPVAEE